MIDAVLEQHPVLKEYLRKNALPSFGDWPTFFSQKKLIAGVRIFYFRSFLANPFSRVVAGQYITLLC